MEKKQRNKIGSFLIAVAACLLVCCMPVQAATVYTQEQIREAMEQAFAELGISGGDAVIEVGVGQTSKMCGHRKENTRKIQEKFIFNTLKVIEKTDIIGYNIKVKVLIGR